MNNLKIFSGTGNLPLAEKVVAYMGKQLGKGRVEKFPDGEILIKVEEDVRGRDIFIIQSTCAPVNDNLMELLVYIDTIRRASADRITAVLPYFGYARQDRKDEGRVPISAKLVANMLTTAGVDRILTLDLHAAQIQGFFDIPVDHLTAEPVISHYLRQINTEDLMLVSPDVGNVKRARSYAQRFNVDLAIIDKRRVSGSDIVIENIIGNVKGKTILMVDDMIATAGTIYNGAKLCMEHGAKSVCIATTHPVLCGPAIDRLKDPAISKLIVTDTIPLTQNAKDNLPNTQVLSVSELLGEAIRRIHKNESVSNLFTTG